MKNKITVTETPKFKNNENKKISIINKEEKNIEKESSNASSEKSFSFGNYKNLAYYESSCQKESETSSKYSIQKKIESHTTITKKSSINNNILPNNRNEISLNEIILRNINSRKKNEPGKKLMNIIDNKIDLNKSVINESKKMIIPKIIEKIKKRSSSKSRNKDRKKLSSIIYSSFSSTSKNIMTLPNQKEKQISNTIIPYKNNIINKTSKNQSNIINGSNAKISMENNSAKNSLERSIRKNEFSPSFPMISANKTHGLTLDKKIDIMLDNQYSLNQEIKHYMKNQEGYMENLQGHMKNLEGYMAKQDIVINALADNLKQLSGDVKILKEKK